MNGETFSGYDSGAMLKLWSELATNMLQGSLGWWPDNTPAGALRQVQAASLKSWAQYLESLVRSPEFLQTTKMALDASIASRQQWNEWLGRAQHELQGASRQDMDYAMDALHHVEQRLVDAVERLGNQGEAIVARLDKIAARLDAIQPTAPQSKGSDS